MASRRGVFARLLSTRDIDKRRLGGRSTRGPWLVWAEECVHTAMNEAEADDGGQTPMELQLELGMLKEFKPQKAQGY